MLSDRCLSVLSVCALWPNGWTDQDETWHAGRTRPWPHCVSSPSPKGHNPHFRPICCGQMAEWIKMSLGVELGLGPDNFVLDGDPAPLHKRGRPKIFGPCLLWSNGWMDEAGTWHRGRPQPRRLCVRWRPATLPKRRRRRLPNFWPISIVAKRLDASRCHLVWM